MTGGEGKACFSNIRGPLVAADNPVWMPSWQVFFVFRCFHHPHSRVLVCLKETLTAKGTAPDMDVSVPMPSEIRVNQAISCDLKEAAWN